MTNILGIDTQREEWRVLEDFIQLCSATWTEQDIAREQEAKWRKQEGHINKNPLPFYQEMLTLKL